MKKLLITLAAPIVLLSVVTTMGISVGCGLLDATDGIEISLPDQEFDFDLDANQAKAELQNYLDSQGTPYDMIDLDGLQEIPSCVPVGDPNCVTVPNFVETFEIDLPAQQVDLSNEPKLKQYIEAGKVKSVKIKYVNYDISENTLNFNLPSLDLYMDELNATEITVNSDMIATIPSIEVGAMGEGQMTFTTNGRDIMSNYLLNAMKFAMLATASVEVDTAVTRTIPGGFLRGKVKIGLSFTVDPL